MSTYPSFRRAPALCAVACAVAALLASACKKERGGPAWDDISARPASVAAHKRQAASWTAAPMMAWIPADTPYVFAMFEPIPKEYWERIWRDLGPSMKAMFSELDGMMPDAAAAGEERLLIALLTEITASLSPEGFARLGVKDNPRFAVYGMGVQPVVRLELEDPRKLEATVARIEARAGTSLPTRSAGGNRYWYAEEGEVSFAIGIAGGELVATFGSPRSVAALAPALFSGQPPANGMRDGAALKQLAGEHGFAPYGLGYVDLGRLVALAVAAEASGAEAADPSDLSAPRTSAACTRAALDTMAPLQRLAFGYDEISAKRISMSAVLELDAATAAQVRGLGARVPGLSNKLPGSPLFAMGGAMDLAKARELLGAGAASLDRLADACDDHELRAQANELRDAIAELDLPGGVRGGVLVLQDVKMADGAPQGVEGYAVLGAADPKSLIGLAGPMLGADVKADGEFHPVELPFVGKMHVAVRDDAIVLAVGDASRSLVKRAISQDGGDAPLLLFAYDAGRFAALMQDVVGNMMGGLGGVGGVYEGQAKTFGQAVMSLHVTDKGPALFMRMDLK